MTTPLPVGYTTAITGFGDSLMAGSGGSGRDLLTCLSYLHPERVVTNQGIGGQTALQIAARQGGVPATLNVSGGSIGANYAATAVTPSVQMLSTAADNTTRYLGGVVAGQHVTLTRTASGGPPSTTETYTVMAAGNTSAVTVPTWAPFLPDSGHNARLDLQLLWLGRNDVGVNVAAVPGVVDACVQYIREPRRYVVLGVMASSADTTGTTNATQIAAANAVMATAYGDKFVPATPPTAGEMTAVGYTPTGQDNTDIGNGIWPTGLRADTVHLLGQGYAIFANRVQAVIQTKGW